MSQAALDIPCPRRFAAWIFDGLDRLPGSTPILPAACVPIHQSGASRKRCVSQGTPMPRGADGLPPLLPSAPPLRSRFPLHGHAAGITAPQIVAFKPPPPSCSFPDPRLPIMDSSALEGRR